VARAPRSFTVDSWEYPSEGKFGVIVSEPARARDDYETAIMEIELDPDKLIELASDLLALGLRQKKRQQERRHASNCLFRGQPLNATDACANQACLDLLGS
jgi:hypothetical protein